MDDLYSVRMRSAVGGDHCLGGQHVSGAERLVPTQELTAVMMSLVERAHNHERGSADFINIVVEKIDPSQVQYVPALPVTTIITKSYIEGRIYAQLLLKDIGIKENIAERAVGLLVQAGHQMRGAVLLDVYTGERLEEDLKRGIRASHMDVDYKYRGEFFDRLSAANLNNEHTGEALVLATKVSQAPGVIAELCWSDDPGYTAGYVASKKYGYVRFGHLKPKGLAQGGRIFFFDPRLTTIVDVVTYLEKQPVLIQPPPNIDSPVSLADFSRKCT